MLPYNCFGWCVAMGHFQCENAYLLKFKNSDLQAVKLSLKGRGGHQDCGLPVVELYLSSPSMVGSQTGFVGHKYKKKIRSPRVRTPTPPPLPPPSVKAWTISPGLVRKNATKKGVGRQRRMNVWQLLKCMFAVQSSRRRSDISNWTSTSRHQAAQHPERCWKTTVSVLVCSVSPQGPQHKWPQPLEKPRSTRWKVWSETTFQGLQ